MENEITVTSYEHMCQDMLTENKKYLMGQAILIEGYKALFALLQRPGDISKREINLLLTETLDAFNATKTPHDVTEDATDAL